MRSVVLALLFGMVMLLSPGAILASSNEEASESERIGPGRLQAITLSPSPAALLADNGPPAENQDIVAATACRFSEGYPADGCAGDCEFGGGYGGDGSNTLDGHFGIMYIRPYWNRSNFSIALPTPTGTFLGDTRDVTQAFNLSPILQFSINPWESLPGLSMSGYMIQFGSALDRNITNTVGNAGLTASNTLSLWVANLPEVTYPVKKDPTNCGFKFQAGFRYNQIQQSYSATLTTSSSTASANLQSFQKFTGFGGTCALVWTSPKRKNATPCFGLFSEIRGSVTVGNNQRSSSFVSSTSSLLAQPNNTISESRVSLVPVGELYMGLEYIHPTNSYLHRRLNGGDNPANVTVRMGCTGQIWGDVAMPSAVGNNQPNNGSLYLVGFLVAGGIDF
jgi:hypothetical protein